MAETLNHTRIRRAAVLIASIDEALGRQLLATLPSGEAALVMRELSHLGDVDPRERRLVLDAFRNGQLGEPAPAAIEPPAVDQHKPADASGGVVLEIGSENLAEAVGNPVDVPAVSSPLDAAETNIVAEILCNEHPQTIAVVLSRMDDQRAADVFAVLDEDVKPDVLTRISNLEPADEEAIEELESQICRRIDQQREKQLRAAAGIELVNRILAKTPDADRSALLARMSQPSDPSAAVSPSSVDEVFGEVGVSEQAKRLAASVAESTHRADVQRARPTSPSGSDDASQEPKVATSAGKDGNVIPLPRRGSEPSQNTSDLDDKSKQLELLDDETLLKSLASVDETTARLALAGSSEKLLGRVLRGIPWRKARRLRKQLRRLPPTPLRDVRSAQRAVLQTALQASST